VRDTIRFRLAISTLAAEVDDALELDELEDDELLDVVFIPQPYS